MCSFFSHLCLFFFLFFFFNDTATTEIYTLSLHDALPISPRGGARAELVDGRQRRVGGGLRGRRSGRGGYILAGAAGTAGARERGGRGGLRGARFARGPRPARPAPRSTRACGPHERRPRGRPGPGGP